MTSAYSHVVCPHCGHSTLYKDEELEQSEVFVCSNPLCDSHQPSQGR